MLSDSFFATTCRFAAAANCQGQPLLAIYVPFPTKKSPFLWPLNWLTGSKNTVSLSFEVCSKISDSSNALLCEVPINGIGNNIVICVYRQLWPFYR